MLHRIGEAWKGGLKEAFEGSVGIGETFIGGKRMLCRDPVEGGKVARETATRTIGSIALPVASTGRGAIRRPPRVCQRSHAIVAVILDVEDRSRVLDPVVLRVWHVGYASFAGWLSADVHCFACAGPAPEATRYATAGRCFVRESVTTHPLIAPGV